MLGQVGKGEPFLGSLEFNKVAIELDFVVPVLADRIPAANLIKEGDMVEILFNTADDNILTVDPPSTVVLEVTYTEPGIKGDTATNTLKPATVETGAEVRVPLFINVGDRIKINTEDGSYMERSKS